MKQFDSIFKESFQSVFLHSSQYWLGLVLSKAQIKEIYITQNEVFKEANAEEKNLAFKKLLKGLIEKLWLVF